MTINILQWIREKITSNDVEPRRVICHNIFEPYDIRGIYGHTLFEEDAYNIGRAFATVITRKKRKTICVGYDCRNSSWSLSSSLIRGLIKTGCEVVSLGTCHTPLMYYAVKSLKLDAGIMVTGSHHPADYNGFKIIFDNAPFSGEDLQNLRTMILQHDFDGDGNGREIICNNVLKNYILDILKDIQIPESIKVAWDIGNGSTGKVIKALIPQIPGTHHLVNEESNGNFPNRAPDPTDRKNIEYFTKLVEYNDFDIGFAFDSDGDRLCVVNSKGMLLQGDQVLGVLAEDFLKKNPVAQIITDISASSYLINKIRQLHGICLTEKISRPHIRNKMKTTGALLAGDVYGHFFFNDRWYGFDDGIYAALRCLEIMTKSPTAFDILEYEHISPMIRIPCEHDKKHQIIANIKEQLIADGVNFIDIDGVKVVHNDGWWLLKASDNDAMILARIEAFSSETAKSLINQIAKYAAHYIPHIIEILNNGFDHG